MPTEKKDSGVAESQTPTPKAKNAVPKDEPRPKKPGFVDNNFVQISMQIKYLPDYNEEYSVKLRPGLGTGKLNFKLEDGWNLTSVGMESDQKTAEILGSVASIIGAVRGSSTPKTSIKPNYMDMTDLLDSLAGTSHFTIDTRPDVPLGFYEPIIATDPHGRKSLFGWRYVGFMPFAGCPVEVCAPKQTIECTYADLYGLIATPNSIKFQKLSEIKDGPINANPYRYVDVNGNDSGPSAPPQLK
jgi:hypothetical protein